MIRHLELLERYLTSEFDQAKARKHMMHIYLRIMVVEEIGILLGVTPFAFISSSVCLLWLILTMIHILPRWRECGLAVWKFFLPVPVMALVTVLMLPFIYKGINRLFDNFVVIAKNPLTVILLLVLGTMAYVYHNSERADRPDITVKKRIAQGLLAAYVGFFAIPGPLRDWVAERL